jgi:DNA-directed RNA polymerase specialized sigma24 family protein
MGKKSLFNEAYAVLKEAATWAIDHWPWLSTLYEEGDIVHEHVVRWLELRTLDKYDSNKRTLRSFVYMLIRRWVYDRYREIHREKRGGDLQTFSFDAVVKGLDSGYFMNLLPPTVENTDNKILLDQIMEALPEKPLWYSGVSKREIVTQFKNGFPRREIAESAKMTPARVRQILNESYDIIQKRFSRTTAVFEDESRVRKRQKVSV